MNAEHEAELLSITIQADQDGMRLDAALALAGGLSRNYMQQLLGDGLVCKESAHARETIRRASAKVREGELYLISMPPTQPLKLEPEDIELEILFEDEHIIVINKPAGMVVHPSHGHDHGTLVHALLHHCPRLPGINGAARPGIVHRLDKDTSGSLAVAKTEAAQRGLSERFASHDLSRQYIAWCRGAPNWSHRRIDKPIGRHPVHRQRMAVNPKGKQAITDAAVEHQYGPFCQLRLSLYTGRTHQIRVHLSDEQLPILGDPLYARSYNPGHEIPEPTRSVIASIKRQALHAELLAFTHPVSGEPLSFNAPLPVDLARLSRALKENYG
jgi:23S rRNA pseudouridine1911/1915/1917 synthase